MPSSGGQAVIELSGPDVAAAIAVGIARVIGDQEHLNRINVFPVPDGDTGTNLALTLSAVRPVLANARAAGDLLERVADAALDGARGNSGALMAQFFQGLADATTGLARLSLGHLAHAAKSGARYARDALEEPREGTMLSVFDAFAERLATTAPGTAIAEALAQALEAARQALAAGPDQLEELRRAGVVDAGASGFVAWVEGVVASIRDGEQPPAGDDDTLDALESFQATAGDELQDSLRYCTECLIQGGDIDQRRLREQLSALGASLVIAGSKRKTKVHIHVDDPDSVFEVARRFGEVSGEKADDMHRQQSATHGAITGVAIITDSAADIPDAELERLNIHVVPLRIHFGDRGYLDKVSITAEEFFEELERNAHHPKTSQPAPGDFRRQFQYLATHYPETIAITLTGAASGTYDGARSAASRSGAADRLTVIDSRHAGAGLGLIVIAAAELAADGHSAPAIAESTRRNVERTRTYALVRDLTYAVRGGRVPASRKWLADLLAIRPVLASTPGGEIASDGKLFGRGRPLEKYAKYIARDTKPDAVYRLAISSARCTDDAHRLAELIGARVRLDGPPLFTELGAALGVHGGPGTLCVGIQRR